MKKHMVRGIKPWHVVADIYVANVIGTTLLFVEYLYVLPLPEEAQAPGVTRDNVVLGIVCTLASWVLFAGTRHHGRIVRSTGPCGAPIPRPEEQQLTLAPALVAVQVRRVPLEHVDRGLLGASTCRSASRSVCWPEVLSSPVAWRRWRRHFC